MLVLAICFPCESDALEDCVCLLIYTCCKEANLLVLSQGSADPSRFENHVVDFKRAWIVNIPRKDLVLKLRGLIEGSSQWIPHVSDHGREVDNVRLLLLPVLLGLSNEVLGHHDIGKDVSFDQVFYLLRI